MMCVLQGGTDAASMLIFDPAALPDDYDRRVHDDPIAAIQKLHDDGRLYWLNTNSDGAYSLSVCMDDGLPPNLAPFGCCVGEAACFSAASGRIYFTGIEYGFHHDDSFLRRHPHMGAYCQVPAGTYRLSLYEMEYPEDYHEDLLRRSVSAREFRLYSLMNRLIPLACISAVALAVSPPLLGARLWSEIALPVCVALALPAILISRSGSYRRTRRTHRDIQRDHPDFCATLQATDGSTPSNPA
jgi:hypothetical protein